MDQAESNYEAFWWIISENRFWINKKKFMGQIFKVVQKDLSILFDGCNI